MRFAVILVVFLSQVAAASTDFTEADISQAAREVIDQTRVDQNQSCGTLLLSSERHVLLSYYQAAVLVAQKALGRSAEPFTAQERQLVMTVVSKNLSDSQFPLAGMDRILPDIYQLENSLKLSVSVKDLVQAVSNVDQIIEVQDLILERIAAIEEAVHSAAGNEVERRDVPMGAYGGLMSPRTQMGNLNLPARPQLPSEPGQELKRESVNPRSRFLDRRGHAHKRPPIEPPIGDFY